MKPADFAKSGSESSHQIALMAMCAYNVGKYPELKWLHAIPNGGLRDKITSGKLKAEGVKPGISDLCLPVKRIVSLPQGAFVTYSGLYVELKKLKAQGVGPSKEQVEFGNFVTTQGFAFGICYGWEEAWKTIELYLNLK